MKKTRDLFKKIIHSKGTFHVKMGLIKDRNGMDLTEAEDMKRGGKNTQNYTKKSLMTQITMIVYHSPRARHPGMQNQEGLRKQRYGQS